MRVASVLLVAGLCILDSTTADALDDCFCLAHGSGAILRGCIDFKAQTDVYATAVCSEAETGRVAEQMITNEWQRIAAGKDRCAPCRPLAPAEASEVPRGSGSGPTAASALRAGPNDQGSGK